MKFTVLILSLLLFTECFSQEIIINETFSSNENKWYVGNENGNFYKIDSGFYHIEAKGAFKSLSFKETISKALYISCSARLTSYTKASSVGIFLSNDREKESALYAVLNPAGLYSIFLRKKDETIPVARWTSSDYIFKADTFNTISVSADSINMNLYINDFKVKTFPTPLYNFNSAGIAVFDSSVADFDELFLVTYPQQEDKFGIDQFNMEAVFSYLLRSAESGFSEIQGEAISDTLYDSRLWLPSAREVFQTRKRYTAIFHALTSEADALHSISILYQRVMKSVPGAITNEGYDDENLPYYIIRKTRDGKPENAVIDLYLFTQENEGKKTYFTAIDIATSDSLK